MKRLAAIAATAAVLPVEPAVRPVITQQPPARVRARGQGRSLLVRQLRDEAADSGSMQRDGDAVAATSIRLPFRIRRVLCSGAKDCMNHQTNHIASPGLPAG
jgi:hypothetical protein